MLNLGLEVVSHKKCVAPTMSLTWLGFDTDTCKMVIKIPKHKLREIMVECRTWMLDTLASRKKVQVLVGKLQFIRCVRSARTFMNRILDFLRLTPFSGKIMTTKDLIADISWFLDYAESSNGLVLITSEPKDSWLINCDSSLTAGGTFSNHCYFAENYHNELTNKRLHIA